MWTALCTWLTLKTWDVLLWSTFGTCLLGSCTILTIWGCIVTDKSFLYSSITSSLNHEIRINNSKMNASHTRIIETDYIPFSFNSWLTLEIWVLHNFDNIYIVDSILVTINGGWLKVDKTLQITLIYFSHSINLRTLIITGNASYLVSTTLVDYC